MFNVVFSYFCCHGKRRNHITVGAKLELLAITVLQLAPCVLVVWRSTITVSLCRVVVYCIRDSAYGGQRRVAPGTQQCRPALAPKRTLTPGTGKVSNMWQENLQWSFYFYLKNIIDHYLVKFNTTMRTQLPTGDSVKCDIHSKPERIVWWLWGGITPGLQVPGTQMVLGRTLECNTVVKCKLLYYR